MTFKVEIWTDDPYPYDDAHEWAMDNCPSFIGSYEYDMSDISSWQGNADTGYEFTFSDEKDATFFALRWRSG